MNEAGYYDKLRAEVEKRMPENFRNGFIERKYFPKVCPNELINYNARRMDEIFPTLFIKTNKEFPECRYTFEKATGLKWFFRSVERLETYNLKRLLPELFIFSYFRDQLVSVPAAEFLGKDNVSLIIEKSQSALKEEIPIPRKNTKNFIFPSINMCHHLQEMRDNRKKAEKECSTPEGMAQLIVNVVGSCTEEWTYTFWSYPPSEHLRLCAEIEVAEEEWDEQERKEKPCDIMLFTDLEHFEIKHIKVGVIQDTIDEFLEKKDGKGLDDSCWLNKFLLTHRDGKSFIIVPSNIPSNGDIVLATIGKFMVYAKKNGEYANITKKDAQFVKEEIPKLFDFGRREEKMLEYTEDADGTGLIFTYHIIFADMEIEDVRFVRKLYEEYPEDFKKITDLLAEFFEKNKDSRGILIKRDINMWEAVNHVKSIHEITKKHGMDIERSSCFSGAMMMAYCVARSYETEFEDEDGKPVNLLLELTKETSHGNKYGEAFLQATETESLHNFHEIQRPVVSAMLDEMEKLQKGICD